VGLLDDAERSLFEDTAVFVGGWTVQAVAQISCVGEDRALELTEALARHSLLYLDGTDLGPRSRMLETVRAFCAERLAARPDVAEVHRRHAHFYRALADQADRPVRGTGQQEWAERLEAEAGNLAATVRWHLANDPTPLPHLFRILWPYLVVWDHVGEARAWVEQLLPAAGSFELPARAELLWAAGVTANEVGDDQAALAACARLAPLVDGLDDPYLRAVRAEIIGRGADGARPTGDLS
jgi:predicted ATPase